MMLKKHFPIRKKVRLPVAVYGPDHVIFITMGSFHRYAWFHKYPDLADSGTQLLSNLATTRGTVLFAWCIMPDHIHILLCDTDVMGFIRLFKGKMVPRASARLNRRRLWQRSFYDHVLRKEEDVSDIALYIWENPVRAALVDDPSEYPWSGSSVWPDWREFYRKA